MTGSALPRLTGNDPRGRPFNHARSPQTTSAYCGWNLTGRGSHRAPSGGYRVVNDPTLYATDVTCPWCRDVLGLGPARLPRPVTVHYSTPDGPACLPGVGAPHDLATGNLDDVNCPLCLERRQPTAAPVDAIPADWPVG